MNYFEFSGKKYIIFGASSGIGRQVAVQLSMLGAKLVLVGRNKQKLQATYEMLSGCNHNVLICDVSEFNSAKAIVKSAVDTDGEKLDGCVFSAGMYTMLPLGMVTEEKINRIFSTNSFSLMAIIKSFSSKRVSNDGASFVSVSSRAGFIPDKSQGVYAASKAAINAYTIVAAKEMATRLIRFNAVCPEAVNTDMGAGLKQNLTNENLSQIYPLGMLEAEDVANTILFLLSDMSKKITGQSIWLSAGNDGGSIEGHIL